jgi:hypothetical protein
VNRVPSRTAIDVVTRLRDSILRSIRWNIDNNLAAGVAYDAARCVSIYNTYLATAFVKMTSGQLFPVKRQFLGAYVPWTTKIAIGKCI